MIQPKRSFALVKAIINRRVRAFDHTRQVLAGVEQASPRHHGMLNADYDISTHIFRVERDVQILDAIIAR
jgi:hypothetical protein